MPEEENLLGDWWRAVGKNKGRHIKVLEITEDGTMAKYRSQYGSFWKNSSIRTKSLRELYVREKGGEGGSAQ